jgi:signal transduction histidine kinase
VRRLSIRVFLAFWSVIVLTLVCVVLINAQIDRYQRGEDFEAEASRYIETRVATPAQEALDRYGQRGLVRWLSSARSRSRFLELHVITEDGRELLGNRLPRRSRDLIDTWRAGALDRVEDAPRRWSRVLEGPGGRDYLLVMTRPPRPLLFRLFGPFGPLGLLAVAIVISGLVSYALARYVTRPMQRMGEAGTALGQGDLTARLPDRLTRRRDEIGGLARDFNRMADRLTTLIGGQQQLLRDVSHELRSPLARIEVALSLAEREFAGAGDSRHLERIRLESERLDALVGEILEYARLKQDGALQQQPLDLAALIDDVVADARLEGGPRKITVEAAGPEHALLNGDETLLRRALENVVRNAVRHSPEGGRVTVSLEPSDSLLEVRVADEGPGVPGDALETIFEPFVRLSGGRSEDSPGGGIGLAIARAAVERHGGRIRARNREAGGLVVTLIIDSKPAPAH